MINPLQLLANLEIVWKLRALPFAYEWYYFLFLCVSLLILISKRIRIPKSILILSLPALLFYSLGVYLSFSQFPKPFTQIFKFSTSLFLIASFILIKESKKDVGFTLLTFSPFLSLFLKNLYLIITTTLSLFLVLIWYRLRKLDDIVLSILILTSFFSGYFAYGFTNHLNKYFFVFLLIWFASYIMVKLFKKLKIVGR